MKKSAFIMVLLLFGIGISAEEASENNKIPAISFENIDFGDAFSSAAKIGEFRETVMAPENEVPLEKQEDYPYLEKRFKSLVRKVLGENNLVSFFFLNDICNDTEKFGQYEVRHRGTPAGKYPDKPTGDYFSENQGLIEVIFKYKLDTQGINVILWKEESVRADGKKEVVEMFTDLKIVKSTGKEVIGRFKFEFVYEGKCSLLFRAAKGKDDKWIVQELVIPKKGSDKIEDGLPVYSRAKEEQTKNTEKTNK